MSAADRQREARRRAVGPDADAVQHALHNPNGVQLLKVLRERFPGEFHVDPYQHAFNAGQADVITWLERMLDFKME